MAKKYMVVELIEREIHNEPIACNSLEKAIEIANQQLKKYMIEHNYENELESKEDYGDAWEFASESSSCAWCNYFGQNYDALILECSDAFVQAMQL